MFIHLYDAFFAIDGNGFHLIFVNHIIDGSGTVREFLYGQTTHFCRLCQRRKAYQTESYNYKKESF
jgi:hypothetical protein